MTEVSGSTSFSMKEILSLGIREVELVVRLLSVVNLSDGLRVREGALGVAERKFMS